MSTRNERFNRTLRIHNAEHLHSANRNGWSSDHGKGVNHLLDALDGVSDLLCCDCDEGERELIRILYGIWLEFSGYGFLVRTFDLICRHERFRDESIGELAGPARYRTRRKLKAAERLYERHRALLEKIHFNQF